MESVPVNDDAVRAAAHRFRRAFEKLRPALRSVAFEEFPRGACGDAAVVLGQYLEDCGLGLWTYRSGCDTARGSHGWIEREGLIVDITADQFDDVSEAVIVTRDSTWHDQFMPMHPHPANLQGYEGLSGFKVTLGVDYRKLRALADSAASGGS